MLFTTFYFAGAAIKLYLYFSYNYYPEYRGVLSPFLFYFFSLNTHYYRFVDPPISSPAIDKICLTSDNNALNLIEWEMPMRCVWLRLTWIDYGFQFANEESPSVHEIFFCLRPRLLSLDVTTQRRDQLFLAVSCSFRINLWSRPRRFLVFHVRQRKPVISSYHDENDGDDRPRTTYHDRGSHRNRC